VSLFRPLSMRAFLAVQVLVIGLLIGFTVLYVAEAQRKICGLVLVMDEAYREAPPATPTGVRMAREVAAYKSKIHC